MHLPVSALTILGSAALSAATSYITTRISQFRQQSFNLRTYRRALLGEVRSLHNRLLEYETIYATRVMTGQISVVQTLKVLMQPGDTVVFSNNAASIGLFDRRTSLRVIRFYSDIRVLAGRAVVLSEAAGTLDPEVLKHEMHRHLIQLRRLRRRALFLIRRLRVHRPMSESFRTWARRFSLSLAAALPAKFGRGDQSPTGGAGLR